MAHGSSDRYMKSFWIGTNQLGCDISVIKTSVWSQFLLNLGIVLPVVSTLLWLKPMADLLIRLPEKNSIDHGSTGWQWQRRSLFEGKDWAGSVGFSPETFQDLKFVGMILTGVIQLLLLRINVQAYLNLGVLKACTKQRKFFAWWTLLSWSLLTPTGLATTSVQLPSPPISDKSTVDLLP
ncbi:hypothetical protein SELMODRAFT_420901 [Selaginella moellendorffii]|uniref:Uncharacterized protein n=1 Tax=Selaginella moellendorffii TaxID=88036 RepID=D8SDH3_SELML|nr:hypothetical protein SELMODRAFT_420901 [Selaginella moellendorffii]